MFAAVEQMCFSFVIIIIKLLTKDNNVTLVLYFGN